MTTMEQEADEARLSRPNFHSWIKSLTTLVGAGQGWEKKSHVTLIEFEPPTFDPQSKAVTTVPRLRWVQPR